MRFIPGSHLRGPLPHLPSVEGEDNVLNQTVVNPIAFGAPVDVELKAGEISLHSDLLLHGSEAEQVRPPALRADAALLRGRRARLPGLERQGRGRQRRRCDRHWANPPRPVTDEPACRDARP